MKHNRNCERFIWIRRLVLFSCAVLLMFLFNPEPIFSEEILPDSILYSINTPAADEDKDLFQLVESYIKIEFSRNGIKLEKITDSGLDQVSLNLSLRNDAPAIMFFNISETNDNITVKVEMYPADSGDILFSASRTAPVDLAIDQMVDELIDELFENAFHYISVEAPRATELEDRVKIPVPELNEPQEAVDLPAPKLPNTESEEVVEAETVITEAAVMPPIRFSSGLAPFIAAGKVNYYFNFGFLVSLQGGYLFETPVGCFEAGGMTGLLIFKADGIEAESRNVLFPLGASGRWVKAFSDSFSINATLTAGIAIMSMNLANDERLNKINAFMTAGGGGSIHFSPSLGMTIEGVYMIFFEKYYPIMGIVPQICFDYRF